MKKIVAGLIFAMLLISFTGCTAEEQPPLEGTVTEFSYKEIADELMPVVLPSPYVCVETMPSETDLEKLILGFRSRGYDEDGNVKKPTSKDEVAYYGVMAVVKVKKSENQVAVFEGEDYTLLSPSEAHTDISIYEVEGCARVITQVEMLERVYQTRGTQYSAGETMEIQEWYFILDARLPQYMEKYNVEKYAMIRGSWREPWYPLEEGETYLIVGQHMEGIETYEYLDDCVSPEPYGIYCLSDREKQAGYYKSEEIMEAGWRYLRINYPDIIEKYAK